MTAPLTASSVQKPITVGLPMNKIVYDSVTHSLTQHNGFRKTVYDATGATISTELIQNGRKMSLLLGPANLLRSGNATIVTTIGLADGTVVQHSITSKGTFLEIQYKHALQLVTVMNYYLNQVQNVEN